MGWDRILLLLYYGFGITGVACPVWQSQRSWERLISFPSFMDFGVGFFSHLLWFYSFFLSLQLTTWVFPLWLHSCNNATIWGRNGFIKTTCHPCWLRCLWSLPNPHCPGIWEKTPLISATLIPGGRSAKIPPCRLFSEKPQFNCGSLLGKKKQKQTRHFGNGWHLSGSFIACSMVFKISLIFLHCGLKSYSKTLCGGENTCAGNIGAGREPWTSTSGCSSQAAAMIYSARAQGNHRDLLAWCLIHPGEVFWWRAGEKKKIPF